MIDMVGNLRDTGRRHRIGGVPRLERGIGRPRIARIPRLQPRLFGGAREALRADVSVEEARQQYEHHDPAIRLYRGPPAAPPLAAMRIAQHNTPLAEQTTQATFGERRMAT